MIFHTEKRLLNEIKTNTRGVEKLTTSGVCGNKSPGTSLFHPEASSITDPGSRHPLSTADYQFFGAFYANPSSSFRTASAKTSDTWGTRIYRLAPISWVCPTRSDEENSLTITAFRSVEFQNFLAPSFHPPTIMTKGEGVTSVRGSCACLPAVCIAGRIYCHFILISGINLPNVSMIITWC